jgi:hypothetical protein
MTRVPVEDLSDLTDAELLAYAELIRRVQVAIRKPEHANLAPPALEPGRIYTGREMMALLMAWMPADIAAEALSQ